MHKIDDQTVCSRTLSLSQSLRTAQFAKTAIMNTNDTATFRSNALTILQYLFGGYVLKIEDEMLGDIHSIGDGVRMLMDYYGSAFQVYSSRCYARNEPTHGAIVFKFQTDVAAAAHWTTEDEFAQYLTRIGDKLFTTESFSWGMLVILLTFLGELVKERKPTFNAAPVISAFIVDGPLGSWMLENNGWQGLSQWLEDNYTKFE